MEINLPVEELRKCKLFVATPMYGGQCAGMYTRSIADLTGLMAQYQVRMQLYYLFNESLITRARNYCVDEFLRSECTHLMFIDSDIGFNAKDVIALLALSHQNEDYDVLCGPYPKKTIAWEKIKAAVDSGHADEDPNMLEHFVGDYVFNPAAGATSIQISEPAMVREGGTGFMLIRREVFEKYAETYPQFYYKPDHVRTANFDGSRDIMAYFDALIDDKSQNLVPEITAFYEKNPDCTHQDVIDFLADKTNGIATEKYSNRYLSEDYMFCYNVWRMGMKVWLCPWMELKHVGSYVFGGSLAAIAAAGAAPTADPKKLGKNKSK
jgi:hypothetical protein